MMYEMSVRLRARREEGTRWSSKLNGGTMGSLSDPRGERGEKSGAKQTCSLAQVQPKILHISFFFIKRINSNVLWNLTSLDEENPNLLRIWYFVQIFGWTSPSPTRSAHSAAAAASSSIHKSIASIVFFGCC